MATPNQLATVSITNAPTPAQRRDAQSTFLREFGGSVPKGKVLPHTQVLACPRVKVADLPEGHLKQKHIEHLEQNQLIASCCRHPENHEVEAFKSHPDEEAPNIYVFHCICGKKHRFFCVGVVDPQRPSWGATS